MILVSILGIVALVILFNILDNSGGCCGGSCNQGRKKCEDDCADK